MRKETPTNSCLGKGHWSLGLPCFLLPSPPSSPKRHLQAPCTALLRRLFSFLSQVPSARFAQGHVGAAPDRHLLLWLPFPACQETSTGLLCKYRWEDATNKYNLHNIPFTGKNNENKTNHSLRASSSPCLFIIACYGNMWPLLLILCS